MLNSDQKRMFASVLLSGAVLFGWQYYYSKNNPVKNEVKVASSKVETTNTTTTNNTTATNIAPTGTPAAAPVATTVTNLELKADKNSFSFKNNLALTNATNDISLMPLGEFAGSIEPLKIQVIGANGPTDVLFDQVESTATKYVGTNAAMGITFTANLETNGKLKFNLNSKNPYMYRFVFNSKELKIDNGQHRQYAVYDNSVSFYSLTKDKEISDSTIKWAGLDFNYHLFALVFNEKQAAKAKTTEQGLMTVDLSKPVANFDASVVYTKKNYDHLLAISNPGDNLHLSVDFGFFAILAVPLLRGLQFIFKYIPNYGIAIILLTIFIRLITFPLQYKSFKSMKKMQEIQPELQKIKEKYKDDNQRMQKETMALFQKAGANPLSGCLPLLLQMPFFFAIYRVLYSAVELVGAPFYGWIHDLSLHDPFYVLPVLMAGSMFLQQKLTPQTSVDPTQQKVMMLMPIIFGFIMKNLPAGLVLYIFVSTTVGILQQYIVYKSLD